MNRAGIRRKTVLLCTLAGAVVLGGCASYYPYDSRDGVYYGKSYDRYGHYDPYGHSDYYSYDYRVYDYRRGYRYRPYGYGYYGRYWRDDDHDRGHDTDSGTGEERASDELRRITQDRGRVRLDSPSNHPPRVHREKRDTPGSSRSGTRNGGSIGQLREHRSDTRDAPRPAPAPRTRERPDPPDRHHEGGIVTPRERDR